MKVVIVWDLDEDEEGNVQHIAEHGIEKDDVAHVFDDPVGSDTSDSSQRPMIFGYTLDGRYIAVIFEGGPLCCRLSGSEPVFCRGDASLIRG